MGRLKSTTIHADWSVVSVSLAPYRAGSGTGLLTRSERSSERYCVESAVTMVLAKSTVKRNVEIVSRIWFVSGALNSPNCPT